MFKTLVPENRSLKHSDYKEREEKKKSKSLVWFDSLRNEMQS